MIRDPDTLEQLLAAVERFVREQLVPAEAEVAERDEIPPRIVQGMRELGLFGLTVPEEYGGLGLTMEEEVMVMLALCQTSPCFRSLIGTTVGIGSQGIVFDGTDEQKRAYLPRLATGELIASFALTEPEAGSDAASLRTRAVRDGDHYIVNGTKRFITNAPIAGVFTLMARTDASNQGAAGVSAFIVDAQTPGITIGARDRKMGQRGAHTADVIFEDCRIPASALIGGREGAGFKTAMKVLEKGRIHIAAVCVGVAERILRDALAYALERRQFGQPIADFQLVQAMLADSRTEIYAARCMVHRCGAPARRRTTGLDRGLLLQAVRLRDVRPRRRPRGADPRWRRLHRRPRHRALLPRRAAVPPVRGHEPDPAARDRAQHGARGAAMTGKPAAPPTRIHQLFDARAAAAPQQPFLLLPDATLTLADLGQLVDQLVDELRADGVQPGDRVLVAAENCPEHVALILACSRIGAWSCGVNARMSRTEIDAFVAKADPRVVYFTAAVSDAASAHARHAGAVASVLPGLQRSPSRADAVAEAGAAAQQVAAIIFTSGTTGAPKGVLVSHAGLLQFARVSTASRALGPHDRAYACLPMTHIFGLGTVLMASLHAGAALVMRSRFDPADVFDALANQQVTMLQGPPAMFARLVGWLDQQRIGRPAAPALRYVYAGAAPLDLQLKRAVEARFGQPLHHGYGLSEYAGALCLGRMGEARDDTAAGWPVDGAELRIVDGTGRDLPAGERGEIWMRGTGLMPGYFRDPEATAQVMRPGGWYASGDIGVRDAAGALTVVGRIKEMIIRSGFNVYPGEVEAVLAACPGVGRVAVAGRREADGNEQVLAFIEPAGDAALDLDAMQAYCAERLAPYKRPSRIVVVRAFPMTLSGKILKRQLVEELAPG